MAPADERRGAVIGLDAIEADDDLLEAVAACNRILRAKGHDYTQGEARLKNFFRNGQRLQLSAEKVLAVYMFKHLDAIETWLLDGQLRSEPIEGRIFDAINYLLLLFKLLKVRERDETREKVGPQPRVQPFEIVSGLEEEA